MVPRYEIKIVMKTANQIIQQVRMVIELL